jgi:hypothetical protein
MADIFEVIFSGGTLTELFNMVLKLFGLSNVPDFIERWKAFFG